MLSIANHQGSANQVRMAITEKNTNNKFGEGVEKKEPSYTVDGNVNWCNHCGKQYGGFSKELNIELLCVYVVQVFSCSVVSNSLQPHGLYPPGSSVHGILQGRILEWVAIHFSRGSSQPWDRTWVFHISGRFFTIWATREAPMNCCMIQQFHS